MRSVLPANTDLNRYVQALPEQPLRVLLGKLFAPGVIAGTGAADVRGRGGLGRTEGVTGTADRLLWLRKNSGNRYELADIPTVVGAAKGVLPVFNVRDYDARANGIADDTTAVQAAVAAAIAASGGIVYFPAGTYVVANGGVATGIQVAGSGVRLIGAGKEVTTLTIANGTNDHVINVVGNDCEIAYLTINGNRANNDPTVHGIRMEGERHHVHDCIIEETGHYGIGLGQALLTDLRYSLFENLLIRNTGGDGIDLKNRQSNNVGNRFSNIIIENYDLEGNTAQAGLDIRGHATVDGLWVYTENAPASGCHLRFRNDATTTGSATNCHLEAGVTTSPDITIAVDVGLATTDVSLSNIYAVGFSRAYAITGLRATMTNCHSLDADDVGFFTRDNLGQTLVNCTATGAVTGFNLEQDGARLIGCRAEDCTTSGVRIAGDDNILADCSFDGAGTNGVLLVAGAEDNYIHDCDFRANSGTDISDAGTRTIAVRNLGAADLGLSQAATIATGAVALSGSWITELVVDTEAAAATDDLATITGGSVGQLLTVRQTNSARDVTYKDGTGNFDLAGDYTPGNNRSTLLLRWAGTLWVECARSTN